MNVYTVKIDCVTYDYSHGWVILTTTDRDEAYKVMNQATKDLNDILNAQPFTSDPMGKSVLSGIADAIEYCSGGYIKIESLSLGEKYVQPVVLEGMLIQTYHYPEDYESSTEAQFEFDLCQPSKYDIMAIPFERKFEGWRIH